MTFFRASLLTLVSIFVASVFVISCASSKKDESKSPAESMEREVDEAMPADAAKEVEEEAGAVGAPASKGGDMAKPKKRAKEEAPGGSRGGIGGGEEGGDGVSLEPEEDEPQGAKGKDDDE